MIPFILVAAGGYLIGDAATKKFSNGGMINTYEVDIESSDIDLYYVDQYFGVKSGVIDATAKLNIEYSLEPEVRKWGIKSIYIHIKNVYGTISWDAYADDLTEEDRQKLIKKGGKIYKDMIEGEIEFSLAVYKDWSLDHSLEFDTDG